MNKHDGDLSVSKTLRMFWPFLRKWGLTITAIRSSLVNVVLIAVVTAGGAAARAAPLVLAQPIYAPVTLSVPDHPAAQGLAGVSLSPSQATVQVLAQFTLDILVDCGTHADAAGAQLTFDPAYMQVVAVTADESVFPEVLRNRFDNVSGIVYYDAGSMQCHGENSCPTGVNRMATITFRAIDRTFPTKNVAIHGQVTWAGDLIFDAQGSGSTITITAPVSRAYLPLVVRGGRLDMLSTPPVYRPSAP